MGDGADARRRVGTDADAALLAGLDQAGRGPAGLGDLEEDEVGLHARRVDGQTLDVGDALREVAGIVVVLGKPVPIMIDRIERGRGDDAGLAHGAAQHLFVPPRLLDEILGAREARADRRAQTFSIVEPQRVHAGGVVARFGT